MRFWATVTSNSSPCATEKLSCLSVCNVGVLRPNGWMIKMPLSTAVGLGLGHIVLDGDPATRTERGTAPPPSFGRCLLWPNSRPSQQLLSSCYYGLLPVDVRISCHSCHFELAMTKLYQPLSSSISVSISILTFQ